MQETDRKLDIVAWRAHRDRNRASRPGLRKAREADFERLFDDHEVLVRTDLAAAHRINLYSTDGLAVVLGIHVGSRCRT